MAYIAPLNCLFIVRNYSLILVSLEQTPERCSALFV